MIRTQIQLTERQATTLKRIAKERNVSMAAVIRDAVETVVEDADHQARRARALEVIGKYASDLPDLARDHDRYLDEVHGG